MENCFRFKEIQSKLLLEIRHCIRCLLQGGNSFWGTRKLRSDFQTESTLHFLVREKAKNERTVLSLGHKFKTPFTSVLVSNVLLGFILRRLTSLPHCLLNISPNNSFVFYVIHQQAFPLKAVDKALDFLGHRLCHDSRYLPSEHERTGQCIHERIVQCSKGVYLWMLEYEFHRISTWQEILFFKVFEPFTNVKTSLSLQSLNPL